MLDAVLDMTAVGQAENEFKVTELLTRGTVCDIILMDLNMPGMDGIKMTSYLTTNFQEIKLVILTMHAKQAFLERAHAAGAKGFILKQVETDELIRIIPQVYHGETYFA